MKWEKPQLVPFGTRSAHGDAMAACAEGGSPGWNECYNGGCAYRECSSGSCNDDNCRSGGGEPDCCKGGSGVGGVS